MDVKKLKQKTILVQYININEVPENGLKRMTYFTSLKEEPDIFYFGLSIRKGSEYSKDNLERWTKEGKLIKLTEPAILSFENDIWLNPKGKILISNSYAPWEGSKKIIGSIK
ncbi:MAG: hypothetical protein WC812_02575 [Candidatus Pacearchaeota archaeon]|jgi:hypothetical protein